MPADTEIASPVAAGIRFDILGPLRVTRDGITVPLGPLKQQQVLAMLLCRANTVTSMDLLTETLWGDEPPRTARKNVQVYVTCLRKLLGDDAGRLSFGNGGYVLRVGPAELDSLEFRQLVTDARRHGVSDDGDREELAGGLGAALGLWRGPLLDGLTGTSMLADESERASLKYLAVFEDWAEVELALGRGPELVERICEIASRYPFRERLRQLQMSALHRADRQAESLSVFDELRQALARELGLRPSPATERLYRSILAGQGGADRPATRPVARTTRVVLPPDISDFCGRTEALQSLIENARQRRPRLTVLAGPVGIGKTTLAVHAAHRLGEQFPDGRIFVRLRTENGGPRTTRSVLLELARFAGLPADPECDQDDLAARWQHWLMEHQVLLVLDDAVEANVVQAVLPLSGGSTVLGTSRRRLVGLEHADRIELEPLAAPEARELLGRVIGTERLATDPGAADRIVRAVGGAPLAVRTAAAKLKVLRHVSLAEFADRLEQPDDLLDEMCTGDGALRRRIADGLTDLGDGEISALRLLGSLAGETFTLDQAAGVLAEGPGRARRLIESLIEANAVIVPDYEVCAHGTVYELPRLLRCYLRSA